MFNVCPWAVSWGRSIPFFSPFYSLLMGSVRVFPWWLSEGTVGMPLLWSFLKTILLEWHICFFLAVLFSFLFLSFLLVLCLCVVCLKFAVFSLELHLQVFSMRSGRGFCFVWGIQSTPSGLDAILGGQYVHVSIVSSNWLLPILF